jgi:hypothetical protein
MTGFGGSGSDVVSRWIFFGRAGGFIAAPAAVEAATGGC